MTQQIPTVRFADPDVLQKMGLPPAPGQPIPPAPQQNFGMPGLNPVGQAPAQIPQMPPRLTPVVPQMPEVPAEAPAMFEAPEPRSSEKYVAPETQENMTNPYPETGRIQEPVLSMDSPNPVFNSAYSNLSKLQKKIVDEMIKMMDIRQLFQDRRLTITYPIIQGSLHVTYSSPTQNELLAMWDDMSDVKGNQAFVELTLNVKYCARVVTKLNNQGLGEDFSARESLLSSFDGVMLQTISDYGRLFDLARTKFLHKDHLEQNPI